MTIEVVSKSISSKKDRLVKGINKLFREIIEEYFPGGFFKWEDYARKVVNKFYSIAYNIIRKYFPKKLFEKIKDLDLPQIFSEADIKINDELYDKIIVDILVYLNENPELLKEYLIKIYHDKKEDVGVSKIGDVFFTPRRGPKEVAEIKEIRPDARVGEMDKSVLDRLSEVEEVVWVWKGIDERGNLKFTLPELYGDRIFEVKLPREIPNIKPGKYTFKVKSIYPRHGAVLTFKEQSEQIKNLLLDSIAREGMGEDQLINFVYRIVKGYLDNYIGKRSVEEVLEDLAGMIFIKGEQISSVEDLSELSGFGEIKEKKVKMVEKREELKKKYEESLEEERKKLQEMINRWFKAPEVVKFFARQKEEAPDKIAKAIASKFPEKVEKKTKTLSSVINIRPVVEMVLKFIMSPHVLPSSARKAPWIEMAWDSFKKMAVRDPVVKEEIISLIKGENKEAIVTDKDIVTFLNSISMDTINKIFFDLKERLAKIINEAEKTGEIPELKPFYDYRKVFREYSQKIIGPYLDKFVEEKKLSPDNPKDQKKIENFIKSKMSLLSDVMSGRKSVRYLEEELEKFASMELINKFVHICMLKLKNGVV